MHPQSFQLWKTRVGLGHRLARGLTIIEILAATAITAILAASLMVCLLAARKTVASSRAMNAARLILQRNIDQALNIPLLVNTGSTSILYITGTAGRVEIDRVSNVSVSGTDENGNSVNLIPILYDNTGEVLLAGTLTRIVTAESVPDVPALSDVKSTVLRRITFKIDYDYLGRDHSLSLTTIRSQDDQ